MIKNRAYQIPPTKKQETIVRRNKIKCKITLHPVILYCFLISIDLLYIILLYLQRQNITNIVSSIKYRVKKKKRFRKNKIK